MKKYFALIITIVILSLSLLVPSFAADKEVIKLSEDYKELYFRGNTYVRVDASMLKYSDYFTFRYDSDIIEEDSSIYDAETVPADYANKYTTKLTEAQCKEVESVEYLSTNHDETLFFIEIDFFDGSSLYIDFIREDLVDEYLKVINGETKKYYVDFRWPDGNIITADKDKFFIGNEIVVDYFEYDSEFIVYASSATGSFDSEIGVILKLGEKYCFFNFMNADIKSTEELWQSDGSEIKVIELTDEELIAQLNEAEQKFLDDDYGYLFNDELKETVAKIFFILVFAIFPLAIAVTTLVLAIKSKKGLYKKLLLATSGLSLASLAVFIYIAFTLFNK